MRDQRSRTFFAFSRDRAIPGWRLWSRVNAKGVPVNAVIGAAWPRSLLTLPALAGQGDVRSPVAFFAVTSIGTIGLYIAYVRPSTCAGGRATTFEPGSWTLGEQVQVDQPDRGGLRDASW